VSFILPNAVLSLNILINGSRVYSATSTLAEASLAAGRTSSCVYVWVLFLVWGLKSSVIRRFIIGRVTPGVSEVRGVSTLSVQTVCFERSGTSAEYPASPARIPEFSATLLCPEILLYYWLI